MKSTISVEKRIKSKVNYIHLSVSYLHLSTCFNEKQANNKIVLLESSHIMRTLHHSYTKPIILNCI